MTDSDAPNALSEPTPELGGGDDLEFGVASVEGKVVMRFNKLIQWFDMAPELAVDLAEALITSAAAARLQASQPNRAIRRATAADLRKLT